MSNDTHDWRSVKPFSAGLKRKPISFVPAGHLPSTFDKPKPTSSRSGTDVSNTYLSLVGLGPSAASSSSSVNESSTGITTPEVTVNKEPAESSKEATNESSPEPDLCPSCHLPILDAVAHERSLAHQASLPHSDPPHSLPRSSVGYKVMVDAGWDPDSKQGLGSEGNGARYPLKAVEKKDKLGIGIHKGKYAEKIEKKVEMLGAKAARKRDLEAGRRKAKMMKAFSGGVDVEAVLRGDANKMEGLR